MKASVRIPNGWRRLRSGEEIKVGSDYWLFGSTMEWRKCVMAGRVSQWPFIRPKARPQKKPTAPRRPAK